MDRLQSTTLSGEDITSAALVDTYTSDGTYELIVALSLSGLAGGGAYRACLTLQVGGAGSAYQSATTVVTLSAGVTTALLLTTSIPVRSGDVVKTYAQGLAGDASVDGLVQTFDVVALSAAGVRTAVGLASANLDTQLSTIDGVVDAVLLDTGTDGVVIADDAITSGAFDESTAFPIKADDSGSTYIARTGADSDTMEGLSDQIDALRTILTRSAAAGSTDADELTCIRGDSYDSDDDNAIEGMGNISDRTKLWIVVKKSATQTDVLATLFCEETAGITRLNGAAYGTAGHSVITVSDEIAGDLRWQLDEAVTDGLVPGGYAYDIQTLSATGTVKTWRRMKPFTVSADVARVIV